MAQRRQRTGQFKAGIVLETLKGQKTINEIASRYGVHPVQVTPWKRQVLEELPAVFVDRRGRTLKYEEVYLRDYTDFTDASTKVRRYFRFYNRERLRQALRWGSALDGPRGQKTVMPCYVG